MKTFSQLKTKYLEHAFLCNVVFLSVLFFAHCFWAHMFWIAFSFLAVFALADNLKNGLSYIVFSIPFCFLNVYISAIIFLCVCLLYMIKIFVFKWAKNKEKPNWLSIGLFVIFVLYCLMPTGPYNINRFVHIAIFAALFVALCVMLENPEIFRLHYNARILSYAIAVASLFCLSWYFSPYLKGYLEIYYAGNTPRLMALFYNTNVLAMFCEALLALFTYFILARKNTVSDVVLYFVLCFIGILTFSKTFLIILCFLLLCIFAWKIFTNTKKTIICVLILAAIIVCAYFAFPKYFNLVFNRFAGTFKDCHTIEDFINVITTDRFGLWVEYAAYLKAHPLVIFFGRGFGAPQLSIESTHNAYLCCIYQLGIVGTLLLIFACASVIYKFVKNNPKRIHWSIFVPITVLALIFMVEDLIFYIF